MMGIPRALIFGQNGLARTSKTKVSRVIRFRRDVRVAVMTSVHLEQTHFRPQVGADLFTKFITVSIQSRLRRTRGCKIIYTSGYDKKIDGSSLYEESVYTSIRNPYTSAFLYANISSKLRHVYGLIIPT